MTSSDPKLAEVKLEEFRVNSSRHATSIVPFSFRLGEWKLFDVRRPLVLIDCDPGVEGTPSLPNPSEVPTDADGLLIKGLKSPTQLCRDAGGRGWSVIRWRQYPRYLVDLTMTFDDYLARFSSKTRSTLKRKMRKLQGLAGGAIDWREYRTVAEIEAFLPLAWELSAGTYQARLLDAGLPRTAAFKAEALARAAHGAVRAHILNLNGRAVSYLFLPVDGARVVYAYLGYDSEFADLSPGTVLQLLAMESMFADPALELFDFTEGDGAHKRMFATSVVNCEDVLLVRPMALTGFVARAQIALERSQSLLASALDRIGAKAPLKRFLRSIGWKARG
jgi:Acetyltransferase (GNAT) domain